MVRDCYDNIYKLRTEVQTGIGGPRHEFRRRVLPGHFGDFPCEASMIVETSYAGGTHETPPYFESGQVQTNR